MPDALRARRPATLGGPRPLQPAVRRLFVGFLFLTLVVELLEWVDASTPLWPHRTVALVSLLAVGVWASWLWRSERVSALADAVAVLALVGTAWGLGRTGAMLAMLIGVLELRALYGSRSSVSWFTLATLGAHAAATVSLDGVAGLADIGMLTVGAGSIAIALVMRRLGEAMARHDRAAAWDAIMTEGAAALLAATTDTEVGDVVHAALTDILTPVAGAFGGFWRGDAEMLVCATCAGAVPDGFPRRTNLTDLPPAAREQLLGGATVLLAGPDAGALGAPESDPVPALHLVPVVWGGAFRGMLAVAAPGGLHHDLQATVRRMATDVALCSERIYSERRFRLLAEASRDGSYLLQLRPVVEFQYVNPAVEQLFGMAAEGLYADASLWEELIHPDDRGILHVMRGRNDVLDLPVQLRARGADGGWRWIEVVEAPVAGDGRVQVVQGIVRDVTRQREQELALRAALAQQRRAAESLRHVDEMKSAFLQAVSHELRTPLTAVVGGARTLEERSDELEEGEGRALLGMVVRNAGRLQRLLSDLLDVDRLSRGIVVPQRALVDVTALALHVVETFEDNADAVTVTGGETQAYLDGPKIERIVDNLVRNALRHTPAGTAVTVNVEPLGRLGARLVVEDHGPGIPDAIKPTIFEPFVQGTAASRAPSPGTGIGLALVHRIAEMHGGHVLVEDRPGGGARFVVDLPGTSPQEAATSAADDGDEVGRAAVVVRPPARLTRTDAAKPGTAGPQPARRRLAAEDRAPVAD